MLQKQPQNLTEQEKEIIKDLLKYYRNVSRCKLCQSLYGLDNHKKEANKELCPHCYKPEYMKRRNRK